MIQVADDGSIMILIEDNQMLYQHDADVKAELKAANVQNGTIIFDTILYSGNTDKRFLTTEIKNSKFKMYRYTTKIGYDHPIRKMTCDFLRTHKESLKNSNLLEEQKKQILSGKNI